MSSGGARRGRRLGIPVGYFLAATIAGLAPAGAVGVRAGDHPGFGRVVFDWTSSVGYRVTRAGDTVTIAFDRAETAAVGRVVDALNGRVISATARAGDRGLEVSLRLSATEFGLRDFRSGTRVVLDLVAPRPNGAPAAQAKRLAAITPAAGADSAKATNTADSATPANGAADPGAAPPPAEKPPVPLTPEARRIQQIAEAARARQASPAVPPATTQLAASTANASLPAGLVSSDTERQGDGIGINFNWRREVGAAVFRRQGWIWVVFDEPARVALDEIPLVGGRIVRAAEQRSAERATVLRFRVDNAYRAEVSRVGTVWHMRLAPGVADRPPAVAGIKVMAEPAAPGGGRVLLSGTGARSAQRLIDPEIGDEIIVVPFVTPGFGITADYQFVEFDVMPSAQGVALSPIADGVSVRPGPEGVVVLRQGGLSLSSASPPETTDEASDTERVLDFAPWIDRPDIDPDETRQALLARIIAAPNSDRAAARFDLARFYLAFRLAPEAIGAADAVVRARPELTGWRPLRALRGAAEYVLGHYAEAAQELSHPTVRDHPLVMPFRAAIAAARGDWRTAEKLFFDLERVRESYPDWLRVSFTLLAAEAALANGDAAVAARRLDWLDGRPSLADGPEQWRAVLRGYLLKAQGDTEGAVARWEGLVDSRDRIASAKARFALTKARRETGSLSVAEAIDALQSLRFAWRGDVLEFDVLRELAKVYDLQGDKRSALLVLQRVVKYFPETDGVEAAEADMRRIFANAFDPDEVRRLSPVAAIALYEEFKQLAPGGTEGDVIVTDLVDRLVEVDLLDSAARLLETQVRERLSGAAQVRVATRAADLRLKTGNPAAALADLDLANDQVPDDLAVVRRDMRARALAGRGRFDEAVALLLSDNSRAAKVLRGDIWWQAENWAQAAAAYADAIDPFTRPVSADPHPDFISAEDARVVLRWSVALYMAGDKARLDDLRERFARRMAGTPEGASFRVVTATEPPTADDVVKLVAALADGAPYEAVLRGAPGKAAARAVPPEPQVMN